MNIPLELAISIMVLIGGMLAWNIHRQEAIWKCVSDIRENFVKKTECKERREECPCRDAVGRLTAELDLPSSTHKRWDKGPN